jgi:hypothetical protein
MIPPAYWTLSSYFSKSNTDINYEYWDFLKPFYAWIVKLYVSYGTNEYYKIFSVYPVRSNSNPFVVVQLLLLIVRHDHWYIIFGSLLYDN